MVPEDWFTKTYKTEQDRLQCRQHSEMQQEQDRLGRATKKPAAELLSTEPNVARILAMYVLSSTYSINYRHTSAALPCSVLFCR